MPAEGSLELGRCRPRGARAFPKLLNTAEGWAAGMVEGMDGGQFLGQESRLGGRNDEGNSITTMERSW